MPKYHEHYSAAGIEVGYNTDLGRDYMGQLAAVKDQGQLDSFLARWGHLFPELRAGESVPVERALAVVGNPPAQDELVKQADAGDKLAAKLLCVVMPPSLLEVLMQAKRFGVPDGTVVLQLLNAGVWRADRQGRVTHHHPPKIESVTKITDLKWLNLYQARVNRLGHQFDWVYAARSDRQGLTPEGDAVIVVPFVGAGEYQRILLIKEFRVPIQTYEYHFPAGLLNPGHDVVEEARRELLEETGYNIDRVAHVTPPLVSSAGLSNESGRMVFCSAFAQQEPNPEVTEDIEVLEVDRGEARFMLRTPNHVWAAKTYPVLLAWSEGHSYV